MKWAFDRGSIHTLACAVGVLGAPGCMSGGATTQGSIEVVALSGDEPQTAAVVVSHRPDGSLIDTKEVDASGRASPLLEDDSLVTVIYPYDETSRRLFTVAIAGHTGELTIHGPPARRAYEPVARLDVMAPPHPDADTYEIRLACAGTATETWPASLDFAAECIGDDGRVPVIVTAKEFVRPVAYAAGLATLDNGVANFDVSSWTPMTPNVPLQTTVSSVQFDWTLWVDGLELIGGTLPAEGGLAWEGLPIDRTSIAAWRRTQNSDQVTIRHEAGAPSAIVFDEEDFPAAIPPMLALTGAPTQEGIGQPLHFSWESTSVPADVLVLSLGYLTYTEQKTVMWNVALSPEATEFTMPAYEGPFAEVGPRDDPANSLNWIDSPDLVGFDDVRAAGVHAPDRSSSGLVVPPVTSGDLRISSIQWATPGR